MNTNIHFYSISKLIIVMTFGIAMAIGIGFTFSPETHASYAGDNIIDNNVFLNSSTMSAQDVQNFLASKGSGLASRSFVLNCYAADSKERQWYSAVGAPCDQTVPASQIIYYAARTYSVNPQVVLATLQKEQSLVTTANPTDWQINQAMGYGCPTTGGCGASNFFYQIDNGTWVLRYHFERAKGNMSWWNNSSTWTCGTEKNFYKPNLYPGQNVSFYDEDGVMYRTYNIANAATSSLYCYTPHAYNNPQGLYGRPAFGTVGRYYSGSYNFVLFFETWFGSTQNSQVFLSYKSHISNLGWTESIKNSGITGTTGQSIAMEAFKINGEVEYSSYNYETGWQPTVNNGMISGTTGQSKPIQAIKINLTGSLASNYELYYRAHVSNVGWMGWTKNGATAGVTGDSAKKIEAFELYLLPKGSSAPGSTDNVYQDFGVVTYSPALSLGIISHVENVGWQPAVRDGMTTGTTEQSKRMEAIKISLANTTGYSGDVTYSAHVANVGWQDWVKNDQTAGTTGQSKRMEAIRIALTGTLGDNYDIWYRGYVQYLGWQGWVKNGSPAGSIGVSYQLEAVETYLVPKNNASTSSSTGGLYNPYGQYTPDIYSINYSTHLKDIGWVSGTSQNKIGGTTGQSRHMEAIRIDTVNSILGAMQINCSAYVKDIGWVNNITQGDTCGTTGQSKPLKSIKLNLVGDTANKYDLYYRVHLSNIGWRDWVKNNEQAGNPESNESIEAIILKLVQK